MSKEKQTVSQERKQAILQIREWAKDVFLFADEALGMKPSEPVDELRGKLVNYTDAMGNNRSVLLFDADGQLTYHDLSFYTRDMFKFQNSNQFKNLYKGKRFTWQQTVKLEAYNRGLRTFDKDSFDMSKRWITTRSGHGTGKTSSSTIIALHFLICFFGAQIGVTANTEDQLKDIFLKEFYFWAGKLPEAMRNNISQLDDVVRIKGEKDWFLRARVARPEKPEALAGLHGEYVLIMVDEASAVHDRVYEVMKGALTGMNYIVFYDSNPTRTEGEFFESHKKGSPYTRLHFSSRESPIVKDGFIEKMEADYEKDSDEVKIRVDGEFAGLAEMDEKGWIPLFANMTIYFEPERGQVINRCVVGVDPAGKGRDSSIVNVRDRIYLKEVLNEKTSTEVDLARKIETIRDAYNATSNDVCIEAFGIGAKVVANVRTNGAESVIAVLTDKPREEVKDKFHTYRSELAWKFREWVAKGGIIITNNPKAWLREMDKIKYKRDLQGRIMLMDKVAFKKEYSFSPDRFDASCMTFVKDEPYMPVVLAKKDLEDKDMLAWRQQVQTGQPQGQSNNFSSM